MIIVYIHGASATIDSFNYIRDHLSYKDYAISYDSANGFENNLTDMLEQLKDFNEIFFVAHSLGGIYALHIANAMPEKVIGAVTLSTPYGGSETADYAKYFLPFSRLLRDIGPSSWPIRQADNITIQHPWCNIVTIKGSSPWMTEPNDGIVTIRSQKHHSENMELVQVDSNHYEVVINDRVVKLIKERLPQ